MIYSLFPITKSDCTMVVTRAGQHLGSPRDAGDRWVTTPLLSLKGDSHCSRRCFRLASVLTMKVASPSPCVNCPCQRACLPDSCHFNWARHTATAHGHWAPPVPSCELPPPTLAHPLGGAALPTRPGPGGPCHLAPAVPGMGSELPAALCVRALASKCKKSCQGASKAPAHAPLMGASGRSSGSVC